MDIAICANWLTNFLVTVTFLNLVKWLGKTGTFWFYAILGIIGLWFIHRKIPETKDKSLEEIEEFWS